jgi:ribosomal protein S12 methylthiotransferase accessory factor
VIKRELEIVLGEGDRVEARWDDLRVVTDQDGSEPAPFDLFLAALGACAGLYVSRFCRQRKISPAEITIRQSAEHDAETGSLERVVLVIELPPGFPERYRDAVCRAAGLCTVKKALASPPEITVSAERTDAPARD